VILKLWTTTLNVTSMNKEVMPHGNKTKAWKKFMHRNLWF